MNIKKILPLSDPAFRKYGTVVEGYDFSALLKAFAEKTAGYASAAKYIATTCMEIFLDARVYDTGMVTVLEIMGRHAAVWK